MAMTMRLAPFFPAKQQAGVGLAVSRTGGTVTYRQDWSNVQEPVGALPDVEMLVRDEDGSLYRTSPDGVADQIRPVASQPEAEAGSNNTKTMTPLRAKQSIVANGRLATWRQTGTGAVDRTIQDKLRDSVHVKDYGAACDGVQDDWAAIRDAMADASARDIGVVQLGAKHKVSATIDNKYPCLLIRGEGDETAHDLSNVLYGTVITPTFAGTVLRHRTPPASELGIPAAQNRRNTGGGFVGITVVGNGIATRLLHVTTICRAKYSLTLLNCVGDEAALFDTLPDYRVGGASEIGEASDCQLNSIDIVCRQFSDTDTGYSTGDCRGVVFDGDVLGGSGNISYNYEIKILTQTVNGDGLLIRSGDNNLICFRGYSYGTGLPMRIQPNQVAPSPVRVNDANVFLHYYANAAGLIEGQADRPNGAATVGTTIVHADLSNSTVLPTVNGTSHLTVMDYNGLTSGTAPAGIAVGDSFYGAGQARLRRNPLTSLHVYNLSESHLVLDNGTQKCGIRLLANGVVSFLNMAGITGYSLDAPVSADGGWKNWTPTYSSGTGSLTGSSTVAARYALTNGEVEFNLTWQVLFSSAGGAAQFTLPSAANQATVFTGRVSSTGRVMVCFVAAGGTVVDCLNYDASSPLTTGEYFTVTGSYEKA